MQGNIQPNEWRVSKRSVLYKQPTEREIGALRRAVNDVQAEGLRTMASGSPDLVTALDSSPIFLKTIKDTAAKILSYTLKGEELEAMSGVRESFTKKIDEMLKSKVLAIPTYYKTELKDMTGKIFEAMQERAIELSPQFANGKEAAEILNGMVKETKAKCR